MPSQYPRERLAKAAASSRTLSEALAKLDIDPHSPTRRYLRDRMRRLGIDISHFEKEGAKWTRERLAEAVADATNMNQVLRNLGVDAVGGYHTHISRRIKALGIDTSHFRGWPGKQKHQRRTPERVLAVQDPAVARRVPPGLLKDALFASGTDDRCALCGTAAEWQGASLPLEVDHIDGDWRNNTVENLRLLCPNCHSTTDNYRGRGKAR